ncbi:MAG TPA: aminotransferase class I/II-fold pyridoxal phosphate-dependent enzyme [Vicinamibacterales bacterium]|nr:aminotransferase class I/II-fold pyridoxal phosphate-dependent enzyme [Vicinamibacterales bacterium]
MSVATAPIRTASRVDRFTYAIRNIVVEAKKVELTGKTVRYLNIGDPIQFGFATPPHLIEAVARAMRDGHNNYTASPGIVEAREAVSADFAERGVPVSPDRVLITSGTSEGLELALTAIVDEGEAVLVPSPTYPLYTAVLAKIGAEPQYYRTDPANDWLPDLDDIRRRITAKTRVLVVIDPNNPTGAIYPDHVRRELIEIAERQGLVILADEVYGDLAYDGPVAPMATLNLDAPIISYSSLSKAYLAPGWRAGWMAVGRTPRLDGALAAIKKLADGRLCSPGPMQYGVVAALTGDRSHQDIFREELRERAALTTSRLNAIDGLSCVAPKGAFYAMPQVTLPRGRTDADYVLALLRATGILCVYGSGFGTVPEDGFFRVVFLASPAELTTIYDDIATFTRDYLQH